MGTLHVVPKASYDACIVCGKPLGADSKDAGFRTCQDHRTCVKCEKHLNAREVQLCHERVLEDGASIETLVLIHPRCESLTHPTLEQDPTRSIKQSEYDYLNMIRLAVLPDTQLSVVTNENNAMIYEQKLVTSMSFDEKLLHMKMLEACLAQCSIALRQDPKYRKDALQEREKRHIERAKKEALTSSRPVSKPPEDEKEILLGEFMRINQITDRKTAQRVWKDREKAINGWMACGMDLAKSTAMVDDLLKKQGVLK